jgi:dihydrofolate synthase/folylpolyglutamate synthase
MPADELAELARDIFGEDRVHVQERLDDAIEAAVALADEADAELAGEAGGGGGLGAAAVLVTGSVVTAGDAQLLLAPASAIGTSSNAGYAAKRPARSASSKQGDL